MRMYTTGIKVPKLGSIQDRVLQQYFSKEAQREAKKTQLLALLTANSVDFANNNAAEEWGGQIKKIWNTYLALQYGIEVTAETEKEMRMAEYYTNVVKSLKVKLSATSKGLVVSGLGRIVDAAVGAITGKSNKKDNTEPEDKNNA